MFSFYKTFDDGYSENVLYTNVYVLVVCFYVVKLKKYVIAEKYI